MRVKKLWRSLWSDKEKPERPGRMVGTGFALMYERFREILTLNNATLEIYATLEDRLSGRQPFSLDNLAQQIRKVTLDVFVMVKNLNQITHDQHTRLYEALERLNEAIEGEFARQPEDTSVPLALPLSALCADDAKIAGAKMAHLGEVHNACGLAVPVGFAITRRAFTLFMSENDLYRRTDRLEGILEARGPQELARTCAEVQQAIQSAPIPVEVEKAILDAYKQAFGGVAVPVAMRSSAVGEDTAEASHAGIYDTLLHLEQDRLLDGYRAVIASAFSPKAVSYRFERGLSSYETVMAVGCMQMLAPRCSGIMFSRPPEEIEADTVVVSITRGIAAGVAAGVQGAEMVLVRPGREEEARSSLVSPVEMRRLIQAARALEAHFHGPQDIEWAMDSAGALSILQTRPLIAAAPGKAVETLAGQEPLLSGGFSACPGVGVGPVVVVRSDEELDAFPRGGVLVAHYSSTKFSRVMRHCSALVIDVGSPTGHMAILAREFRVPAIVGLEQATAHLRPRQVVTVDATSCRVYEGALFSVTDEEQARPSLDLTPAQVVLDRVMRHITPLNLIDPAHTNFTPEGCLSLHDITRYIHEKSFEVMFHFGDRAAKDKTHAMRLQARLPIDVYVFDVGGGICITGEESPGLLDPQDICSVPMVAFLDGLQDPRIRWDLPRPVSMRGFLSVLGESMTAPPPEVQKLGKASYAIISDRYMNFSTKAGYHFSTVDSFCDEKQNKNYIHFRFAGGAADATRRARRVRFLSRVLGALDFKVQTQADLLVGRLDKFSLEQTRQRLSDLGRLTLCVRQMDMLMSSDGIADLYAQAFLDGEWSKF